MKKIVLKDIVQRSNTRPHGDMAAELLTRIRQVPEEGIARKEKGEKGKGKKVLQEGIRADVFLIPAANVL